MLPVNDLKEINKRTWAPLLAETNRGYNKDNVNGGCGGDGDGDGGGARLK